MILAVFLGALLFQTSQSVQKAEKKLSEISRNTGNEQESLRVLSAEWDYLNRPERLERLALDNLDLDADITHETKAIEKAEDIPEPMMPVLPPSKPSNLMQYVATKQRNVPKTIPLKSSVIQKRERENFEALLSDVTKEDMQ
jgi:hypothetical protein